MIFVYIFIDQISYLHAKKMKTKEHVDIRPLNKKNSEAWSLTSLSSATRMTRRLPAALVRRKAAWTIDFMEVGASL